ncbi:MAG: hypothetical protein J6X31_03200 [Bacteroidales bacterium]|nr:hypothetical protein [Bacteroidales bacterium]
MKNRAANNRTLTLQPDEVAALQQELLSVSDLRAGHSPIDHVIHADMTEAL